MLLVFTGLSGTGKTSHARATADFLRKAGHKVTLAHQRLHPYLLIFKILGWDKGWSKIVRFKPLAYLWWANLALAYLVWLLLRIIIPLRMGYVVVADKYAYDLVVRIILREQLFLGWKLPLVHVLISASPDPDKVWLLNAPVRTCIKRAQARGDPITPEDVPLLPYEQVLYVQMAREVGIPIINTNHSFEEVQSKIEEEIR